MVTAMKARELGRNSVVVGDRVALAGDTSGAAGTLARIVRVE
jgi:ribosome biogenesis GTPase